MKPIHEVIKFRQTDADNAREWAGVKTPEAKPATQAPKFGKRKAGK